MGSHKFRCVLQMLPKPNLAGQTKQKKASVELEVVPLELVDVVAV